MRMVDWRWNSVEEPVKVKEDRESGFRTKRVIGRKDECV